MKPVKEWYAMDAKGIDQVDREKGKHIENK